MCCLLQRGWYHGDGARAAMSCESMFLATCEDMCRDEMLYCMLVEQMKDSFVILWMRPDVYQFSSTCVHCSGVYSAGELLI